MRNLRIFALAAISLILTPSIKAVEVNGSIPFAGIGVSQSGASLDVSTQLFITSFKVSSAGTGDYSAVNVGTNFTAPGGGAMTLDLSNLSTFVMENIGVGTFNASGGSDDLIVTRNANFLDVYLRGTFTPAAGAPGGLNGKDPTTSSFRFSFTQSGTSVSSNGTLASPAQVIPTPEPSTYVLTIISAATIWIFSRRRSNLKIA